MFRSVQTDRISKMISDQIKEAIFQKKVGIGDKLPPERQLMEQFEASRVSVREALRTLEYSGIVEIKRGAEGGAFIRDPNTKFINNFLQDIFSMGKVKVSDLTEARLAVEPFLAKMTAERINESSLEQLKVNVQETKECLNKGNESDARLLNLEFHRIIAQASENPVMFFMIDSITDIMERNISSIPLSVESLKQILKDHEKIYSATKNRNPGKAQSVMLKHILDIQRALETCRKETPI